MQDAVCIDIESHFYLWDAARCRGNAIEAEASEGHVIRSQRPFTLQDVDIHSGLVISSSRIGLSLAHGNSGIALDHLGHYTSKRFHTQRKRGDIKQQNILDFATEHTTLNSSADS